MGLPKVNFKYDLKKDAWSWVLIAKGKDFMGYSWRDQVAHIPDDLLINIKKTSITNAEKIVQEYIKRDSKRGYKAKVRGLETQALKESWKLVEEKYFKVLSEITQKPIFKDKFDCYFTTGLMCPYNEEENWFMASMWHSIPSSITTICHEIMHLQFLHYYRGYLKKMGLNKDQIEVLKEALTFLLNEKEFEQITLSEDSGYPDHEKIREKLHKIWIKEKDFQKFLNLAIVEIKK